MHRKLQSDASGTGLDEVLADYMRRLNRSERVDQEALVAAHPDLADELRARFSDAVALKRMAAGVTADFAAAFRRRIRGARPNGGRRGMGTS